jgi:prepilin-type N-terminal cleavage/methylation domain-containing protein
MHCRDQQRYVTDRAVRGFSLLEVVIVTSLLAFLAWLVVPNITAQVNVQKLPRSAEQLRGLLRFTRAQAQLDGLRYRVRFRMPDELANPEVFDRWYPFQPVVEIEREPLLEPGVFKIVTNSWAMTPVLYEPVRCARVRTTTKRNASFAIWTRRSCSLRWSSNRTGAPSEPRSC